MKKLTGEPSKRVMKWLQNVFVLLNREYIPHSVIAFAMAIPFSFYAMQEWLAGFQFRVVMGWQIFAGS